MFGRFVHCFALLLVSAHRTPWAAVVPIHVALSVNVSAPKDKTHPFRNGKQHEKGKLYAISSNWFF